MEIGSTRRAGECLALRPRMLNLQAGGRAGTGRARKRGEPGGGAGSPMGRSEAAGGAGSRRRSRARPLLSPRLLGPLAMSWRLAASVGKRLVVSGWILAGRRGAAGAAGSGYAARRGGAGRACGARGSLRLCRCGWSPVVPAGLEGTNNRRPSLSFTNTTCSRPGRP